MLHQLWYVKEPSLLKDISAKHGFKFAALSPVMRKPPDNWNCGRSADGLFPNGLYNVHVYGFFLPPIKT
jgi:hypothetical protein